MWPWLALAAAIVVGRAISLRAALRVIGWAGTPWCCWSSWWSARGPRATRKVRKRTARLRRNRPFAEVDCR
jgi:hypothetical protein